jgi:hypothetical protein
VVGGHVGKKSETQVPELGFDHGGGFSHFSDFFRAEFLILHLGEGGAQAKKPGKHTDSHP